MPRIEMPPATEDFAADPSELFFDLAYVFAFSQVVHVLALHPDVQTILKMALLFILLWMPWQQMTWAANAVPGNSRPARIIILTATVLSIPLAASIGTAFGNGGEMFAISTILIFALGVGMMMFASDRDSAVHKSTAVWALINAPGMVLLLLGSMSGGSARVWFWSGAAIVFVIATIIAGRYEWVIRSGHFSERHGLIVIVALGEIIVAIASAGVNTLDNDSVRPWILVRALIALGAFAALLWWGYFNRLGPALEHCVDKIDDPTARGRLARTIYTWNHAPVVAGIMLTAAGLEHIALDAAVTVTSGYRQLLVGGLAVMVFGFDMAIYAAFKTIAWERTIATLLLALVLLPPQSASFITNMSGLMLLTIVDVVMFVSLVVEDRRIEYEPPQRTSH